MKGRFITYLIFALVFVLGGCKKEGGPNSSYQKAVIVDKMTYDNLRDPEYRVVDLKPIAKDKFRITIQYGGCGVDEDMQLVFTYGMAFMPTDYCKINYNRPVI